jgi:hypothetical protein
MDEIQEGLTNVLADRRALLIKAGGASVLAALGTLASQVPVYANDTPASCDLFPDIVCRLQAGFESVKELLNNPQPSLEDIIRTIKSGMDLLGSVISEIEDAVRANPTQTIELGQLNEVIRLWFDFVTQVVGGLASPGGSAI